MQVWWHLINFFFSSPLSCSQSLEGVEGGGVARGIKEKARTTAPTPQQLPPHLESEAAELPSGLAHLPPCHRSTKCLHSTTHDGYRCLEQDTPHSCYACLFYTRSYSCFLKKGSTKGVFRTNRHPECILLAAFPIEWFLAIATCEMSLTQFDYFIDILCVFEI